MSYQSILLLAIGLAMDATAVAAARGLAAPAIRTRHVALVAALFGGFQALMPVVGWLLGGLLSSILQAWAHFIAFVVLVFAGGKMLWEARGGEPDRDQSSDPFAWKPMLALAVATSMDALAVGVTLPMLGAPFALSIVTIGVVTALMSAVGLVAGRRFGGMLGKRLDLVGGLVLIGFGVKILLEHFKLS